MGITNPAVTGHRQVCRRRPITFVISHPWICWALSAMSSVIWTPDPGAYRPGHRRVFLDNPPIQNVNIRT